MREHLVRAPYMAISRGLHSRECARCTRGKEASSWRIRSRPFGTRGAFSRTRPLRYFLFGPASRGEQSARVVPTSGKIRRVRYLAHFPSSNTVRFRSPSFLSAIRLNVDNYDLFIFLCGYWHCYDWRRCERNSNNALYCYCSIVLYSQVS